MLYLESRGGCEDLIFLYDIIVKILNKTWKMMYLFKSYVYFVSCGSLTWKNCIFSRLDKLDSIYDLDKCKTDSGLCRIIRVYSHFLWLSGCTWLPNLFRQSHLIRILSEDINLFVHDEKRASCNFSFLFRDKYKCI